MIYTINDVRGATGMNHTRQTEICKSMALRQINGGKTIRPLYRDGGKGHKVKSYTKSQFDLMLRAAGYVPVIHEGEEKLVIKKYLKEWPGARVISD